MSIRLYYVAKIDYLCTTTHISPNQYAIILHSGGVVIGVHSQTNKPTTHMKRTIPGISASDRQQLETILPLECKYKPAAETIDKLLNLGNTIVLSKGDTLINAGEYDPNLYIVTDGLLRCYYWDNDKEVTDYFSSIPTLFFDYHSYYGGIGAFYCYEACIDSRVVRISKNDYEKLIAESHDLARWILCMSQYQIYAFEGKERRSIGEAYDRYLKLLKHIPEIENRVPLRTIASYLRITPQYLSMLRREHR